MEKNLYIDASHPNEIRIVLKSGEKIEDYEYEGIKNNLIKNNIYLGKVSRIEPSLQAAFVDFGRERHGFLSFNDIQSDYYQIPQSDLEKIKQEEERVREELSKKVEAKEEENLAEGKLEIEDPLEKKDPIEKKDPENKENLEDEKEKAEHMMLVDLARNDLSKVSEVGTVQVDEMMIIEKYSHVMHMTSNVIGQKKNGATPIDCLIAALPAGTLSGTPKIRAMEILSEHEKRVRGIYGGSVGYIGFNGNLDTAIVIRTAIHTKESVKVGVGGGVPAICHVLDAASQVNHLQSKQAYPCGGLACRLC